MPSIRRHMKSSFYQTRAAINKHISRVTSKIHRSPTVIQLNNPAPRYNYEQLYLEEQYFNYREWWNRNRPIVPYTPSHNIATLNFGVLPTGDITPEIEEFFQVLMELPPQIRRTIGAITDITGMNKLAPAI